MEGHLGAFQSHLQAHVDPGCWIEELPSTALLINQTDGQHLSFNGGGGTSFYASL